MTRALSLAVLALTSGCSLALDFGDQCSADSECGSLLCIEGLCASSGGGASGPVLGGQCTKVYGVPLDQARSAATILIGSLFPFSGDNAVYGPGEEQSVELAIDEINQAGGIFGKKVALLSCDDGSDTAKANDAVKHLADAGVHAVIGPDSSSFAIEIFNAVAYARGLLVVSNAATSPALSGLKDDNLFWRTVPSDASQGAAIAAHLIYKDYKRVAVVNRNDAYGTGLALAIQETFCANAGTCTDTFTGAQYDPENPEAGQANAIIELKAFKPDVIVLVAFAQDGISFINKASTEIELRKPFVVSDGVSTPDLLTQITDDALKCNILGTLPAAPSGKNYQTFTVRYKSRWGADAEAFGANAYDALYAVAYAYAAVGGDPRVATGPQLAAALGRLSAGQKKDVGPGAWNDVIQILSSGKDATVDIEGASGPLDFNSHGEPAAADVAGWRLDVKGGKIETLTQPIYTADEQYHPEAIPDRSCP